VCRLGQVPNPWMVIPRLPMLRSTLPFGTNASKLAQSHFLWRRIVWFEITSNHAHRAANALAGDVPEVGDSSSRNRDPLSGEIKYGPSPVRKPRAEHLRNHREPWAIAGSVRRMRTPAVTPRTKAKAA